MARPDKSGELKMNNAHKTLLERIDCGMLEENPITEIDEMAVIFNGDEIILGFPGVVINLNLTALEKINELVKEKNENNCG
jgi:hypothetical protein